MSEMNFINEENAIRAYSADGKVLAEITFPETAAGEYTINHTFVDSSLHGKGVASELMQQAVDAIQKRGGKVLATCPYAVKWLAEKRE